MDEILAEQLAESRRQTHIYHYLNSAGELLPPLTVPHTKMVFLPPPATLKTLKPQLRSLDDPWEC